MVQRFFSPFRSSRKVLIGSSLLIVITAVTLGIVLWHSPVATPVNSAQAQCPPQNAGALCPHDFSFVTGQVNVTSGIPSVILFSGHLPTSTTGIFGEHGHYGYGLYLPVTEAWYGGTLIVNGTTFPSGAPRPIAYHVTIQYLLGNSTVQNCNAQPNIFTPTLSEYNRQSFSC